ncbi:MAG: zinc ribbon domain-containing protein [Dehalococcoidia bacterium]
MPIYEFKCADCGRLSSIFTKSVGKEFEATCQHCGGRNLSRAVSRFAYHRSEQAVLGQYGAEPKRVEDYKDPRQIGRWTERKFKEYGLELPEKAREMIDAAREGELPEPVKDL